MALCAGRAHAAEDAAHWQPVGWGGGGFFWACAFHPTNPDVIYLGGDVGGEDQGKHWRFINNGLSNYAVYSLAVSRSSPDTLYAMTLDGVCKSTDGGELWQPLAETARNRLDLSANRSGTVRGLAVDPTNSDVVYAGTRAGKLYKTQDGGRTWANLPYLEGLPKPPAPAAQAFSGKGFLVLRYDSDAGDWQRNGRVERMFPAPGTDWSGYRKITARFFVPAGAPRLEGQLVVQSGEKWLWQAGPFVPARPGAWTELSLDLAGLKDLQSVHFLYFVVRSPQAPYHGEVYLDTVALHADAAAAPAAPNDVKGFADWEKPGDLEGWRANRAIKDALFVSEVRQSADAGPKEKGVLSAVAVAETDPRLVLACSSEYGLLRSEDAGATWAKMETPGIPSAVAFFAPDANVVYGAFGKEGARKSTDRGATWSAAGAGIPAGCVIREVVVDRVDADRAFCIGSNGWNGTFFHTEDGGKTWTSVRRVARDLAGGPTLPEETGGGALPRGVAQMSRLSSIALCPARPSVLFIAGNWSNCLSTDGGRTWEERVRSADITCAQDIRFRGGKTYVAAMDEGLMMSPDGGQTWRQVWPLKYTEGTSGHQWRILVRAQGETERIVATVSPWAGKEEYPNGVLLSDDGGKSFTQSAAGLPSYVPRANTLWGQSYARALAADPNHPDVLYLGMDGDPEPAKGRTGGGIFRSEDGGRTWQPLAGQPACRRVFFGLEVDPTDSRRLFWGACGSGGGVHCSEDAGQTWQHVFRQENWVFNLAVAPSGAVLAGGQNLHRSADHGRTWKQISRFPAGGAVIVGIAFDPKDENRIWISRVTWGEGASGGVYRTTDGGATWQEITGDLPYRKPLVLRYNPDTAELWAGGVGLYKIRQ